MAKFSIMLFGIDSYTKHQMQLPYKLDAKTANAALREARMCAMTFYMDGKLYGVRWDDEPEHEGTTSEIKTRIVINGEELIALRNPDGSVGFIRSELLKPVEGELNKEFAQICVRPADQGQRFIYAVKDGMILRALIAPMNIKDNVADDLDEIIAELMSRRQKQIIEKMHDDLQDLADQEAAEKTAQVKNREEK